MRLRALAIALGAAAALVPATAGAAAGPRITAVDTSGYPRVRVTVVTSKPSAAAPTLTEDGAPAAGLQAQNLGKAKSIVLAVDRSRSMKGKPLEQATKAAQAFVRAKPAADRIAISTFATSAVMLTGFSTSTIDADQALGGISVDPVQGTKLYDDIVLAAKSLAAQELPARVIILVTDGNETRSQATLVKAIEAANKARASVYVVAIESSRFTPAPLRKLAASTGGKYYGVASSNALASIYAAIAQELRRTWRLDYLAAGPPGQPLQIKVSVPGQGSASREVVPPKEAERAKGRSALPEAAYGPAGVAVLALLVGGLVMLAYAFVFSARKADRVRSRVAPHVARAPAKRTKKKDRQAPRESLATLLRVTERAFGHTRYWQKLGRLLERADLSLKTAELVYVMLGASFLLGILFAFAGAPSLLVFLAFLAGGGLPLAFVAFKARRRVQAFDNQLADILISMAASLKAGHSFKSGLQAVVDEGYEPASKEFKRVLTETRLGRPMDDALADMADRIGSKNLAFIVTAVSVQTQVGGSMAGLFDMVGDTVRNRQQFARKIKALTAMGRMSTYVLVALPFGLAGMLTLINPSYMAPLWTTSAGHMLLIVMIVMMAIGSLLLKRIISFKG